MIKVDRNKEFSLDAFIENVSIQHSPQMDKVFESVIEIYEILFHSLTGKYEGIEYDSLFDYYTFDEIEWFADQLLYYPNIEGEELESLHNIIVQSFMSNDVISKISQVKPTRKKGFVFI